MSEDPFELHVYETSIQCTYLLHAPETIDENTLLVAALHGYGSNAEDMLRLTVPTVGRQNIIASLQAPHQHYVTPLGSDARAGYNWGVRQQWQSAVAVHHRMVLQVLTELHRRFGLGSDRTVLLGFSQPVGLNYRFAATHPGWVQGVVGICGGVPRDWDESQYQAMSAAILHISRDEDEFYPLPVVQEFAGKLRKYSSDVEFHLLPGAHRFPSKAGAIVRQWMERRFRSGR
jgi:phospholipase/carboxylesterase